MLVFWQFMHMKMILKLWTSLLGEVGWSTINTPLATGLILWDSAHEVITFKLTKRETGRSQHTARGGSLTYEILKWWRHMLLSWTILKIFSRIICAWSHWISFKHYTYKVEDFSCLSQLAKPERCSPVYQFFTLLVKVWKGHVLFKHTLLLETLLAAPLWTAFAPTLAGGHTCDSSTQLYVMHTWATANLAQMSMLDSTFNWSHE